MRLVLQVKDHYDRGASILGAACGGLNFCTDTWQVEAAEAAADAAAAAAAVASATACAIRISEALFGASAFACAPETDPVSHLDLPCAHTPSKWPVLSTILLSAIRGVLAGASQGRAPM